MQQTLISYGPISTGQTKGTTGAEVRFVEIENDGHTWPGHDHPSDLPNSIKPVTVTTRSF